MNTSSWKKLICYFAIGLFLITVVFVAYFGARVQCPNLKSWFDRAALDTNAITAYFTALTFIGFLTTSLFQAHSNAVTIDALENERKKDLRLRHDSMWLNVQIARLDSFSGYDEKDKRNKTREEIEQHWARLSKEINDELKKHNHTLQ